MLHSIAYVSLIISAFIVECIETATPAISCIHGDQIICPYGTACINGICASITGPCNDKLKCDNGELCINVCNGRPTECEFQCLVYDADKSSEKPNAETCKDIAEDCSTKVYLCNHPRYGPRISMQCAKSCGKCSL